MSVGRAFFSKGNSSPPSSSEEISAYLGKQTFFEGKMTFEGIFRLDGKFEGEIFESGTLIVGETASIKGRIGINSIIINGRVEGEVHAKTRVEIHSTGKLYGTVSTPVLVISEGGILEGHCQMDGSLERKEDRSDLPSSKTEHPFPLYSLPERAE